MPWWAPAMRPSCVNTPASWARSLRPLAAQTPLSSLGATTSRCWSGASSSCASWITLRRASAGPMSCSSSRHRHHAGARFFDEAQPAWSARLAEAGLAGKPYGIDAQLRRPLCAADEVHRRGARHPVRLGQGSGRTARGGDRTPSWINAALGLSIRASRSSVFPADPAPRWYRCCATPAPWCT